MTASPVADRPVEQAYDEEFLRVPAGDADLFAVRTVPRTPASPVGVLLIHPWSMAQNRLFVGLARDLGARAVANLRIDLHGRGESTGVRREIGLDGPTRRDVLAGADLLRRSGVEHLVLVGSCWSALAVLAAADGIPETAAVVMMTPPFEALRAPLMPTELRTRRPAPAARALRTVLRADTVRRVVAEPDYGVWLAQRAVRRLRPSPREGSGTSTMDTGPIVERLAVVAGRGVSVHALYGDGEDGGFETDPRDRPVRDALGDALRIQRAAGTLHGQPTVAAQAITRAFVLGVVAAEVAARP